MSGKNLPDRCSKSGAAFCAWQHPNVSMSAATDSKTYAERWSVKPGLLDPFHVAFCCVKRLKASTFVNVKYNLKKRNSDEEPDKSQLCIGLQIYMNPMIQDSQVSYDVNEHVNSGSAENVAAVIRRYPCVEQVLLFLMKYLKERGPLIKFKYDSIQQLNKVVANPRYIVSSFLTNLCEHELEFHAAVTLGDYLNFVVFVAYAHDLFWLKEILVDTWGPLLIDFINVGDRSADNLQAAQKASKTRLVMYRLIETVPWEKLKTQENFKITINPQINDSYLKRKATEAAHQMGKLTTKPLHQKTLLEGGSVMSLLGSLTNRSTGAAGSSGSAEGKEEEEEELDDPAQIAAREAAEQEQKRKQEEKLRQEEEEAVNRDFSSEYGYTDQFLQKYAPHGMCQPGFDPTLEEGDTDK